MTATTKKKVKKKVLKKKKRDLDNLNEEIGCQTEEAWEFMTTED